LISALGLALIAGGIFLSVYSFGRFRRNAKVEFDGMQPGGVVGFDSPKQAARHDMMKRRARLTGNFGVVLIIVGVIVTLFGFVRGSTPEACWNNENSQACLEARAATEVYYDETAPAACRMRPDSDMCRRALRERGETPADYVGRRPT
jgi:hypothetical protein